MKDIYSPLEIDEEWDQRAPDMGSNEGAGTNVAVAPAPEAGATNATSTETGLNMGASTLAPSEPGTMQPTDMNTTTPNIGESVSPVGDMMHDPAHDTAEMAMQKPDTSAEAPADSAQTPSTLEIGDMSSNGESKDDATEPTTEVVTEGVEDPDGPAADTTEATEPEIDSNGSMKVNVMGDGDPEAEAPGPEAGAVIEPQVKPDGMEDDMSEPEKVEPEPKEDKEPAEEEEPELPASPIAEAEETDDKEEPIIETKEPETAEIDESDMDSTDKRLMAAIDRWKDKKAQEVKDLTELKDRVEADIKKMNSQVSDLQNRVSAKEGELDSIGQLLDEIGEVETEPKAA